MKPQMKPQVKATGEGPHMRPQDHYCGHMRPQKRPSVWEEKGLCVPIEAMRSIECSSIEGGSGHERARERAEPTTRGRESKHTQLPP